MGRRPAIGCAGSPAQAPGRTGRTTHSIWGLLSFRSEAWVEARVPRDRPCHAAYRGWAALQKQNMALARNLAGRLPVAMNSAPCAALSPGSTIARCSASLVDCAGETTGFSSTPWTNHSRAYHDSETSSRAVVGGNVTFDYSTCFGITLERPGSPSWCGEEPGAETAPLPTCAAPG